MSLAARVGPAPDGGKHRRPRHRPGTWPPTQLQRLLAVQTLSLLADSFLSVALALYVLDSSGSPALSAATVLARMLPAVLLGALGGALVDRWDRRRLLFRVSLLRSLLVLPLLLVVVGWVPISAVLALELLRAVLAQTNGPAVGASLPVVVAPDDLPRANARIAVRKVVVQLAAPSIGAALYAGYGLAPVVLLNALLYVLAALTWLSLTEQPPPGQVAEDVLGATLTAFHLVRSDAVLRPLLTALLVSLVGLGVKLAILVPFVRQELHGSAQAVGALTSLEAAGGVVAALTFPRLLSRFGIPRLLGAGMWALPLASGSLLLSNTVAHAAPGALAAGLLLSLLTASLQVYLQTSVQVVALGRVLGIVGSTIALGALLGTALAVALSLFLDLRTVLVVAVAFELVGAAIYVRPARSRARTSRTPPAAWHAATGDRRRP